MKFGYARVSTKEQNPQLQIDALKEAGCDVIYTDHVSGSTLERPEFQRLLEQIKEGDLLVVWKLDRFSRSLRHCVDLLEQFQKKGVGFLSLTDNINTTKVMGRFMAQILAIFAELERDLIRERTQKGLEAARSRGITGGRPQKLSFEDQKLLLHTYENRKDIPVQHICNRYGISKATLYAYKREHEKIREERENRRAQDED